MTQIRKTMKILLYTGPENRHDEKIKHVLGAWSTTDDFEIFQTVNALTVRLKRHTRNIGLVLLFIPDKNDLSDILAIRDLLIDLRIILILPDSDKDMRTMAYSLYPRFIHYSDNDLKDVVAVMKKMYGAGHQ